MVLQRQSNHHAGIFFKKQLASDANTLGSFGEEITCPWMTLTDKMTQSTQEENRAFYTISLLSLQLVLFFFFLFCFTEAKATQLMLAEATELCCHACSKKYYF